MCNVNIPNPDGPSHEYWGNTSAFARTLQNASMLTRKVDLQSFGQPNQTLADELLQVATLRAADDLSPALTRRLALHYHGTVEIFYPILNWNFLDEILESVDNGSFPCVNEPTRYILLNLVLAISCASLRARDSQLRMLAHAYFDNVLANDALRDILTHPSASALQISLLMSIFVWYCPGRINAWRLLGNATRMCLDLVEKVGSDEADSVMIGTLYRTTYVLESQVAISFGRPRQLPEARDEVLTGTTETYPADPELSKLVYELARLRNRLHRDLIGNSWAMIRTKPYLTTVSDYSWMNTCIFEINAWLEKWIASVGSLRDTSTEASEVYAAPNLLLSWGQLQQAEALLLAKFASDSRSQLLLSADEEVMAAQRLLHAAEALQGGLSYSSDSSHDVLPMPWSKAFAVFDAGVALIRNWASTAVSWAEVQESFHLCTRLLIRCDMPSTGCTVGLSSALRLLLDACVIAPIGG